MWALTTLFISVIGLFHVNGTLEALDRHKLYVNHKRNLLNEARLIRMNATMIANQSNSSSNNLTTYSSTTQKGKKRIKTKKITQTEITTTSNMPLSDSAHFDEPRME